MILVLGGTTEGRVGSAPVEKAHSERWALIRQAFASADKAAGEEQLKEDGRAIDALQDRLWAERKRALLVVHAVGEHLAFAVLGQPLLAQRFEGLHRRLLLQGAPRVLGTDTTGVAGPNPHHARVTS